MKRIDAFLTGRAQYAWPESVVYWERGPDWDRWVLDRGPRYELAELGEHFHKAKEALGLLLKAEAARMEDMT